MVVHVLHKVKLISLDYAFILHSFKDMEQLKQHQLEQYKILQVQIAVE